jgi:hypothetical protein
VSQVEQICPGASLEFQLYLTDRPRLIAPAGFALIQGQLNSRTLIVEGPLAALDCDHKDRRKGLSKGCLKHSP